MLPTPGPLSPWAGKVLVRTPDRDYTADDVDDFLEDVGYAVGPKVHARIRRLIPDAAVDPGVNSTCLYSLGVATPLRLDYSKDWAKAPKVHTGDGDGTVNAESLRVCEAWASDAVTFANLTHSGMIADPRVIDLILALTV